MWYRQGLLAVMASLCILSSGTAQLRNQDVIDLSLIVAPEYPCNWPEGFPRFRLERTRVIGRESPYNIDTLTIDGNTGTQMDVPPHSVARPALQLPHSGPFGDEFTEKTPAWKFVGEACVIDLRELLDQGAPGVSPLVRKQHVQAWENSHRQVGAGDVVLFRSDYTDTYYRPFPEGRRFLAEVLEKKHSGYPDPEPETMDYIASRGVFHIGTDSPSMGTLPAELADPAHLAALKYGAIFTEGATNLGKLPATGAFYCMMGPRHEGGPYGEGRAFAIMGSDAERLIASARNKRVRDLSVVLSVGMPATWPGKGVDRHRHPYTKYDFAWADRLQLFHHGHIMDSHAGTHLVPPAFALPDQAISDDAYAPEVRIVLDEYQRQFGRRGVSDQTTEKVSLSQTCGPARLIDVTDHVGSTTRADWPASPAITVQDIQRYEAASGRLKAGEIVIFRTGHVDRFYRPLPEGAACLAQPINGLSEGWPALSAEAGMYLADRGIQCVATDAPALGSVVEADALKTYWALGSRGMVGVEFLTNLADFPDDAYFLFAPVKIRGCHGGPGRAILLY
jgi:kynurenine formamidase